MRSSNVLPQFNRFIRRLLSRLTAESRERQRLSTLPRYTATTTTLPGVKLRIPDGPSFVATWREVMDRGLYRFTPERSDPRILDCGANVGISCLYFRREYPDAKITAFEPDPKIFDYLRENVAALGLESIELIQAAVWNSNCGMHFKSEGADAGRIDEDSPKAQTVPTVRLYDFLDEPIDLLKIDIEGAETEVLLDAAPRLQNVRNLFVEYHSFTERPQTLARLLTTLHDADFRVALEHVRFTPQPFLDSGAYLDMDLQLNIFAYRRSR